jgi:putative DNA primase/helicase
MINNIEQATAAEIEELSIQAVDNALLEQTFTELAALPPIDYDRKRADVAKTLGIRVPTLDAEVKNRRPKQPSDDAGRNGDGIMLVDPEKWDSHVDGVELLDAIRSIFEKYIVLPVGAPIILALWVLHTYLLDAADATPIIAILSPEKRCGKTLVLEILQNLVRKPLPASNITASAMFRTIAKFEPTLLVDEADCFLPDNEELRGVLNSGHRRGTAVVIRTTGEDHEPKTFSTWCCKAIALIGKLSGSLATIGDRSIVITMRRKSSQEHVEKLRHRTISRETNELRQKAARWADDYTGVIESAEPVIPEVLNDRAADCWRPLLAIADVAGGDWPEQARAAATMLAAADASEDSVGVQLLADIREIFTQRNTDRLSGETLVEELGKFEDRPWPEWKHGKAISKPQLSRLLKRFDIVSKTIRTDAISTIKGYELSQFHDAFSRYIGFQNVTASQPLSVVSCDGIENVTGAVDVTKSKASQPASILNCDAVTFPDGVSLEEETI